jgi:hypothetical protein
MQKVKVEGGGGGGEEGKKEEITVKDRRKKTHALRNVTQMSSSFAAQEK